MKSISITKEVLQRIPTEEECYPLLQTIGLLLNGKLEEVPERHLEILGLSEEVLHLIESLPDYDPTDMNENEMRRYAKVRSGLLPQSHTLDKGYANFEWADYRNMTPYEFERIFRSASSILAKAADKKEKLKNNTAYTRLLEYIKTIVFPLETLASELDKKANGVG